MKINWNRNYTTMAVYLFLVICCSMVFYRVVSNLSVFRFNIGKAISIVRPFIVGGIIAYVMNFVLVFWEDHILVFDKLSFRRKRALSLVGAYLTAFVFVGLFSYVVFPQLINSIYGLVNDVPYYISDVSDMLDDLTKHFNVSRYYLDLAKGKLDDAINYSVNMISELIPIFGNMIKGVALSLWNVFLGIVISIYLLMDKESFCGLSKKITYAIFPSDYAKKIIEISSRGNYVFRRFIGGKLLDSLVVGILLYVVLSILKIPYAILISVIMGTTNVIPFFGPFIGAVPSVILVLFVSPVKALWFLGIVFVVQQIDANIIEPRIVGRSVGISAFWILFSLLIAGSLFGFVGMIIGVPVFAVIYSIVKEIVENKLEKRGLPRDTRRYM